MLTLDLTKAQLAHSRWKTRLRSFIDGKEDIPATELSSERDCELGKWLYAEGMNKYGKHPKMGELERLHAEMHHTVKQVVDAKKAGRKPEMEQGYKKVQTNCDRIVGILGELEKELAKV
jgi:hypothetical protein